MSNGNQQYLAPSRESTFQIGLSRQQLQERILYDDDSVFDRLGIQPAPQGNYLDFIEACAESVVTECADKIKTLRKLCRRADRKDESYWEGEDPWEDPMTWRKPGVNLRYKEEKRMYKPLSFLFSYIANFTQAGRPHDGPQRVFKTTKSLLKAEEPHTFGVTSVSSAFTGLRITATPESQSWNDREMFVEVKPSSNQGPNLASKGFDIPPILGQSANYARLLMTARPFMLYCTGLLVFGTKFCVGLFDREGIIFSPIHDMFDDLSMFVTVVRTLTCRASLTQLGLDPSVKLLSIQRTRELTRDSVSRTFLKSRKLRRLRYPSALVTLRTDAGALSRWCTIGYPIWSSHSLFGRGTNVWHVRLYVDKALSGPVMVMKTSWRNSGKPSESEIYGHLTDRLVSNPGLAQFECGGDVVFPKSTRIISVQSLRSQLDVPSVGSTLSPILHRLVLKSIGRPMWEYDSEYQLLRAFRDVIRAHQLMCNQGILHRDISPGNILLAVDEASDVHGLLCDVELALIKPEFDVKTEVNGSVPLTGTTQFMAKDLLNRCADKHEQHHDLESFIWSFAYCVWRKLWQSVLDHEDTNEQIKNQKQRFYEYYSRSFSHTGDMVCMLTMYRVPETLTITFVRDKGIKDIVQTFMSPTLIGLFNDFPYIILRTQVFYNRGVPLTHDDLLEFFDKAISSYE